MYLEELIGKYDAGSVSKGTELYVFNEIFVADVTILKGPIIDIRRDRKKSVTQGQNPVIIGPASTVTYDNGAKDIGLYNQPSTSVFNPRGSHNQYFLDISELKAALNGVWYLSKDDVDLMIDKLCS